DVDVRFAPGAMRACGSHDGYDRLPGCPRHSRTVCVEDHGELTVTDRVDGRGEHVVEGGFLLAPEWTVREIDDGWELTAGTQRLHLLLSASARLQRTLVARRWHPEYGREVTTTRLTWRHRGAIPLQVECRVTDVS
ncbi:MAG: heparinase II/III family protein, partial [Maioricimonas sp. JB049]